MISRETLTGCLLLQHPYLIFLYPARSYEDLNDESENDGLHAMEARSAVRFQPYFPIAFMETEQRVRGLIWTLFWGRRSAC